MLPPKPIIVVTGAGGQVANALKELSTLHPSFDWHFFSKSELNILQPTQIDQCFQTLQPSYCINCAAYTAVDMAETERDLAMQINATAVGDLANACSHSNTKLIHISTDYVFDGTAKMPYKETDPTHPVNYYGLTKLKGEELCFQHHADSIILRTSWVYSSTSNNFIKTMLRLMKERTSISVVDDQYGTPTYAADLAAAILHIIQSTENAETTWQAGVYHYSNEGIISWYDFAMAIKNFSGSSCTVKKTSTENYPTPAKRPMYSVLNKEKIIQQWGMKIPAWENSLSVCLKKMN
jgi:dTDP-4-dehydrorhamnose reductase